jgi:hypothetical protein
MKDIVAEHYNLAIYEYENGTTLNELRSIIKYYEDLELYEICQGVCLAVEVISFHILYKLVQKESKHKLKLKWKSTKKLKN